MHSLCCLIFVLLVHCPWVCGIEKRIPKYIWNLGLAQACDITPFKEGMPSDFRKDPAPDPVQYIKNVKDNDIIWIQSIQLARFCKEVLPHIRHRFVLVLTHGDEPFPAYHRPKVDIDRLIQDPRVIHIFAQNVNKRFFDAKVTCIPIGLNFHSIACSGGHFGEAQQSVVQQERQLTQLLSTLLPTSQRIKKAYVDFQLADRGTFAGESRTSIFKELVPTGLIDYPLKRMPRGKLWEKKGEYAFSISPRGRGLDCHRTWEDLVLGCIVIVKTSPLDPLYKGLPVVIVKKWSEITEANMDKWLLQYGDAFTNPSYRKRLTHAYWKKKIRRAAGKLRSQKKQNSEDRIQNSEEILNN